MNSIKSHCPILIRNKLPNTICPFALNSIRRARGENIVKSFYYDIEVLERDCCDWYILDEESCHCFWKFWSNPDNVREYTLEEIAALTCVTTATVYNIEQKALAKIALVYINNVDDLDFKIENIQELKKEFEKRCRKIKEVDEEMYETATVIRIKAYQKGFSFHPSYSEEPTSDFHSVIKSTPFIPQKQMKLPISLMFDFVKN